MVWEFRRRVGRVEERRLVEQGHRTWEVSFSWLMGTSEVACACRSSYGQETCVNMGDLITDRRDATERVGHGEWFQEPTVKSGIYGL